MKRYESFYLEHDRRWECECVRYPVVIVLMVAVLLTFSKATLAIAQLEDAILSGQLNIVRDQVTIVGTKGQHVTRTLLLHTQNDSIKGVKVIPLDLNRPDEQVVFSKQRIWVETPLEPLEQIEPNTPRTVSLTFDLRRNKNLGDLRSGQFKGVLLVNYEGGQEWVPVSVTVKDPIYLPILVLLLGVGLGVLVSRYRTIGKPRDEVIVRIDALRKQMEADQDLAEAFRKRLNAEIIDVEAALRATQWDEARTEMAEAEAIWTRWRRGREDWIIQFRYLNERLRPRLQDLDSQALTVQHTQRQLEDLEWKATGFESPDNLREQLQDVTGQINRFAELYAYLEQLKELRSKLSDEANEKTWQANILDFRNQLRKLKPTDELSLYQQLEESLSEAVKALRERIPEESGMKAKGIPGVSEIRALLEPLPGILRSDLITDPSKAVTRLQWFTYGSYAIAILLLVWAGFEKLYVARPDFGVSPSSDYFSLLVWGFGAEATRAAIIGLIQGQGASESK